VHIRRKPRDGDCHQQNDDVHVETGRLTFSRARRRHLPAMFAAMFAAIATKTPAVSSVVGMQRMVNECPRRQCR
jgi:hypothetical protein